MITYAIIALTCLVSIPAFNNRELFAKALFNPYIIKSNKEWYRFFTHALVHADWIHLFFNMFVLYSFGQILENHLFPLLFTGLKAELNYLLLYVGALLASSIPDFEKNKNNPHYSAVGASGAVAAVLFAGILIDPMQGVGFMFIPFPMPGFVFGALYLLYSWYMSKKGTDNIGHDAHFWGAVFGFVFTGLLKPELFLNFINQLKSFFS